MLRALTRPATGEAIVAKASHARASSTALAACATAPAACEAASRASFSCVATCSYSWRDTARPSRSAW